MCHLIFLAPVLAVPLLWLLPMSIALPVFSVVLGLTALVAWPVVVAMRRPQLTGAEGMIGARAEVITELNPHGIIRCQGEVWSATADEPIAGGERVRVLAMDKLRLRVTRRVG